MSAIKHALGNKAKITERSGKWVDIWCVVGEFANVSIFNVESPAEFNCDGSHNLVKIAHFESYKGFLLAF